LAEIAGVLGRHAISIASVIQHEATEGAQNVVPLVIMTHTTSEGAARGALEAIERLTCLRSRCVRMRVRE
jgi:homoserine dehydrogenase